MQSPETIGTRTVLAILGTATALTVNGAAIEGSVAIAGVAILDNPNSALATSASVPLAFGATATGDFSPSIGVGTPIAFTSPLVFGVTSGLIWTGGAGPVFSFTASAPLAALVGPNNTLSISALGVIDDGVGGLDPTAGQFVMAITPTAGGVGSFGSIVITAVPEPSAWASLAAFGLVGFAAYRRIKR